MALKNIKHQRFEEHSCRRYHDIKDRNCLALTLADTDFAFPDIIKNNVNKFLNKGNLSYTFLEDETNEYVNEWYKKRFDLDVSKFYKLFGNGVIYWIQDIMFSFTKENDGIIIQTPVYDPFTKVIEEGKRKVVQSYLKFENNIFSMDFQDLEEKFKKHKLLLLCNPHNPTGNVWSKGEMTKLLTLAKKYNVIVMADEIWQDFVYEQKFKPLISYNNIWNKVISISSPSKSFNIGGMQFGYIITPNKDMHKKLEEEAGKHFHYASSNAITTNIVQTAYTTKEAEKWLDNDFKPHVFNQRQKLMQFLRENNIEFSESNATFLVWAKLGIKKYNEVKKLDELLRKNHLHITLWDIYGKEFNGWTRINVGISNDDMDTLIKRLTNVLKIINKKTDS